MHLITKDIKVLLKLCNINCFLPYYNERTGEFKNRPLHQTVVLLIYLLAYGYMYYIKIIFEGALFPERGRLFTITSTMLALIGFCWVLINIKKNRIATVQQYFDTFEEIDRTLSAIFKVKINRMKNVNAYTSIFLMVYLISLLISYHLWIRDNQTIEYELHFIGDIIMIINNLVIVLVQVITLEGVKRRYDALAKIIEGVGLDGEKIDVISYRIDCVSKIHNTISDLVVLFNKIFSWKLLAVIFYIVTADLMSLSFFVTGYYREDVKIYISLVLWTILVTMQVVMVAIMCQRVINAGRMCTVVTYKATSKLSGCGSLRKKIIILGSQMEASYPKFTAAGFFNIDYAMLFTFINLMVTYIIVIIQFDNNK